MAQKLLTFQDIYEAVAEEIGVPTSDTSTINRIKRNVNMVYINEVVPAARWPWLNERVDKTHEKQYNDDGSDTASVTNGSTTVTLSSSIPASEGSKAGYFFKAGPQEEVYRISSHTSGSDTLTLETQYNGSTDSDVDFKIWTDIVSLPQDASEVIDAWHEHSSKTMIPVGTQKLQELAQSDFSLVDFPRYYATEAYENGTTESARNRYTRIWPARLDEDITLHLTYKKEVTALDNDSDEPIIPIEDRIILFYGAAAMSWKRETDSADTSQSYELFNRKLQDMIAKWTDGTDMPVMELDDRYLRWKRNAIGRGFYNGSR